MRGVIRADYHVRLGKAIGHCQQFGGFARQINSSAGHVDHDQQLLIAEGAGEGVDMRVIRIEQMPVAGRHDRHVVAQRDELLVEGIYRIRIVEFAGRVDRRMVGIDGDPWLLSGIRRSETGIDRAVPLGYANYHDRARRYPPTSIRATALWLPQPFDGKRSGTRGHGTGLGA